MCLRSAPGDIGAVVKLKDTHTGNTLAVRKSRYRCQRWIIRGRISMPSLKSSVKGEEDKIASGLAALHHEDPTFQVTFWILGQRIIHLWQQKRLFCITKCVARVRVLQFHHGANVTRAQRGHTHPRLAVQKINLRFERLAWSCCKAHSKNY